MWIGFCYKDDIRKNYFTDIYDTPIYENGIQLKDIVMLIKIIKSLSYRPIKISNFEEVCNLPQCAGELFFMFPKAKHPFDKIQCFGDTYFLFQHQHKGYSAVFQVELYSLCYRKADDTSRRIVSFNQT